MIFKESELRPHGEALLQQTMESKKRKLDEPASEGGGDRTSTAQSANADLNEKRRRQIGPALPPSSLEEHDQGDEQGSESESDDDFGPSWPPAGGGGVSGDSDGKAFELESQGLATKEEQPTPKTSQQKNGGGRDSWMLQPPDSSDWSSRVDPTKLRNRKFQSGRSAKGATGAKSIDSSWTETPEQKMNRLQNQVMGAATPSASENPAKAADESRSSEKMRERVKRYNVSHTFARLRVYVFHADQDCRRE